MQKKLIGWTIIAVLALAGAAWAQDQTKDKELYDAAKKAVYQKDWTTALEALETLQKTYAKSGYMGQLYNVTGLSVTSTGSPVTVDGGANIPLGAWQNLDDGSYLAVAPGSVTWSVVSGPITGISSAGLAQAGAVAQNTAAINGH